MDVLFILNLLINYLEKKNNMEENTAKILKKISKKKKILIFLNNVKRASTGSIAANIRSSGSMTEAYLNELVDLGRVVREQETRATYWRLK